MRFRILLLLLLNGFAGLAQLSGPGSTKDDTITFLVEVKLENATKDGLYTKGPGTAILNIGYQEIERLDGKTIEVKGIGTVVKGIKNRPKEYDEQGEEIILQGREDDTAHFHMLEYRIVDG